MTRGGEGTAFKLTDTGYVSLIGDSNADNRVDFVDLLALAQHYGQTTGATWAGGDFTFDAAVNFDDLLVLAQHYGQSAASLSGDLPPAVAADWALARSLVPEPTMLTLLAAAGVVVGGRRRAASNQGNV